MTANPNWPEVRENLLPHKTGNDRPDIISRVFHLKLKELLCDLLERNALGHVIAYVNTIEFKKRGLPHVHMFLFCSILNMPKAMSDDAFNDSVAKIKNALELVASLSMKKSS